MTGTEKLNKDENTSTEDVSLPFNLRPPKELSFNADTAKEVISSILNEELSGKTYDKLEAETLCLQIGNRIKMKMRTLIHENYKIVCHIRLGEQRGAGIRVVARCLWDSEGDKVASASFESDSIFCVASVFVVYFY